MRKPSIHITEEALIKIVRQWFLNEELGDKYKVLVDNIIRYSKNYQLTHRKLLEYDNINPKQNIHKNRITASIKGEALEFINLLESIRTQKKHRGITKIREGDTDWQFVKEATGLANDFCKYFNLKRRAGYIEFIKIFLELVKGKFSLRRVKANYERICDIYNAVVEIENDPFIEETEKGYDEYSRRVYEKTGHYVDYAKSPEKYIHFVYASQLAKRLKITTSQFVIAQFETLSWATGIPIPSQFSNENAEERAIRWMAENNISHKKVLSDKWYDDNFWDKFNKMRKKYEDNT